MTPKQKSIVEKMKAGCALVRSFDVYGGYWYWLRPINEKVRKATAEAMVRDGIVIPGEERRVYSGYRENIHTLAP